MSQRKLVHEHLNSAADEVLSYIREAESAYAERWVPATTIKSDLALKIVTYPRSNETQNPTGWVFAALARILEDRSAVEFRKRGNRSYYRSKK